MEVNDNARMGDKTRRTCDVYGDKVECNLVLYRGVPEGLGVIDEWTIHLNSYKIPLTFFYVRCCNGRRFVLYYYRLCRYTSRTISSRTIGWKYRRRLDVP